MSSATAHSAAVDGRRLKHGPVHWSPGPCRANGETDPPEWEGHVRRRLLYLFLASLLILSFAGPASAAKPIIDRFTITEVFIDEFWSDVCGFEVTTTVTGHAASRVWLDDEGNFVREVFTISLRGSLSAGGDTLHFRDAGMDKVTQLPSGGVQIEVHGNVRLITVPGQGVTDGAAGRLVFTLTPLLDEEGNPVLDEEGFPILEFTELASSGFEASDIDAICEALTPPA